MKSCLEKAGLFVFYGSGAGWEARAVCCQGEPRNYTYYPVNPSVTYFEDIVHLIFALNSSGDILDGLTKKNAQNEILNYVQEYRFIGYPIFHYLR